MTLPVHQNCRCRLTPIERSPAEGLIDAAVFVLFPRSTLVLLGDGPNLSVEVALSATAVRFYRQTPGFKFRAIFEGWSLDRIVREMNV